MSYTFGTLKTAIQNYTDNSETTFVSSLPDFIESAEQRILNAVDLQYFRKNATGTTTSGNQFLLVPTDYLASFSLSFEVSSSKTFLLQKDVNFLQEYTPNPATTGAPIYYAYFDNNSFLLAPTPDASYTTELHYFYRPASLTSGSDSGTTWLSTNAPNAMLYGTLVEAYIFMKGEPDMMNLYQERFNESLIRLKDYGEARENSDAYRRGLVERERT
jgi:hypothetical protein|tara:strand:- start:893 stop:1540 length:648 start_codon:yes stop_codon:yes gene_type:complete